MDNGRRSTWIMVVGPGRSTWISVVGDIKKEVKQAALECMTSICNCTGNKDLEPFLPAVVDAASSIDKTHSCA